MHIQDHFLNACTYGHLINYGNSCSTDNIKSNPRVLRSRCKTFKSVNLAVSEKMPAINIDDAVQERTQYFNKTVFLHNSIEFVKIHIQM